MSDALLFVLVVLASYRVWRLFAIDALPPFTWTRDRVEKAVRHRFGTTWAAGVSCPWCSGWWLSCAVVAATWAVRPLPLPALWFGAVSTAVGLLARVDEA